MAKGKAVEALTDKVMGELEKKFTEIAAKQPISEAAKAIVVDSLTGMARPHVKRFIDGAASGKLPNPVELAQTVLKEVLPRVPGIVAAATGGGAAPPAQQAYGQQQGYGQPIEDMPRIAVYVYGAEDPALNKAMATRLIAALSNSGRYRVSENHKDFFEQIAKEQKGGAASINSEQIGRLGGQFGAQYVCVAEIATVLSENQASAHIIKVETGEIAAAGVADVSIKTPADLNAAAEQIVEKMFKRAPPPAYMPPPPLAYAPAPQPVIIAQPAVNTSDEARTDTYEERQRKRKYEELCGPGGKARFAENKDYCKALYRGYSIDDFTSGQRWGTFWLNYLIPGLGSFVIMKDVTGGVVQSSLLIVFVICVGESNGKDNAVSYIGMGAYMGSFMFNIARSSTYHKPYHKSAQLYGSAEDAGLKWAVFPDKNGDMKAGLRYSANF
jgi:hypothetical protein